MKLLKILSLVILGLTMLNCNKNSDDNIADVKPVSDVFALKERLKSNNFKLMQVMRSYRLNATNQNEMVRYQEVIHEKAEKLNSLIEQDIKVLTQSISHDEFMKFVDAEFLISKGAVPETPCFDAYQKTYLDAIEDLAGCMFTTFQPFSCSYDYYKTAKRAMRDYEDCMNKTYGVE